MAMTLAELRTLVNEELKNVDESTLIVMSKDAEGNNFSPLSDYSVGWYEPTCTWAGEYYNDDDHDSESEDDVRVVCLWPVS